LRRKILILLAAMVAVLVVPLGASAPASASTCSNPRFVTSGTNGMWNSGGYVVHNNMWNVSGYNVRETLSACSYRNWRVVATANNRSGDGAVKTYPNVHKDYHNWSNGNEPRLSSFRTIRSSWAARTPRVGIYNAAYDIWLNGVPGNREVMIWTDNYRQTPAGRVVARNVHLSNRTWKVYATGDNHILTFLPSRRTTHGTIRIKSHLNWLVSHGRVGSRATLGQICFGFEIVSTGGNPAKFKVDNFSVSTTRR
jgi:hypothetical protein